MVVVFVSLTNGAHVRTWCILCGINIPRQTWKNYEDVIPFGRGIRHRYLCKPVAWYWLGWRESPLAYSVTHWSRKPKDPSSNPGGCSSVLFIIVFKYVPFTLMVTCKFIMCIFDCMTVVVNQKAGALKPVNHTIYFDIVISTDHSNFIRICCVIVECISISFKLSLVSSILFFFVIVWKCHLSYIIYNTRELIAVE